MRNILVLTGSPKVKKGNSDSIANFMLESFKRKGQICKKGYIKDIIQQPEEMIKIIKSADIVIISFPVYQNSVPSIVLSFFEFMIRYKSHFSQKHRSLFVLSNSGLAEPKANVSSVFQCQLFAKSIGFYWLGGIGIAPGTLIDGKKLEDTGKTYKKVIKALNLISDSISKGEKVPDHAYAYTSKPLIWPKMYRFFGKLIQNKVVKKIGKVNYYARPYSFKVVS